MSLRQLDTEMLCEHHVKMVTKIGRSNYNPGMPKIVRYHLVFITFLITVTKYMKQFKMWRNVLVHEFRGNLIGHHS